MDPDRLRHYRERVFAERSVLRAALRDGAEHQRTVLADLLAFNADTEFGTAHGFRHIRTAAEFRKAVPISEYAGLEAWIERAAAGEHNVLTADDPALYFTSSGSTGAHKKIPVTPTFMRTTFFPFFYAAWAPMAEHFPEVLSRPDSVLNLKHDPLPVVARTASGRSHLGASQVDFGELFGEPLSAEPGTDASWARLPNHVDPADHLEKMYLRLRRAIEGDVRCVIGINPAMVAAVPYQLVRWWERLVRDVRDGTAGGQPYTTPNPVRAAELEELTRRFGTVRPAHVWPNLRVIFCWTTGLASLYLPRLREEFGVGVSVLPAPVAASEGPVGVTLDRHADAGSLVVTAAVYEFVPADEVLAPDSTTWDPHELQPGKEYHVVFSHIGGLYRYAVGDVVRVEDMTDGVPRLSYAGRAAASDLAGETLRESQLTRALARALGAGGLEVRNAACRPHAPAGVSPRYEFAVAPRIPWTTAETELFTERLDDALGTAAPRYRRARVAGALAPLTVHTLPEDAFLRDWHDRVAAGVRPAQVKDRLVYRDTASWRNLLDKESHG
jgi:hypothetical protein